MRYSFKRTSRCGGYNNCGRRGLAIVCHETPGRFFLMCSTVLVIKKHPAAIPLFSKDRHYVSPGKKETHCKEFMAIKYSRDKKLL